MGIRLRAGPAERADELGVEVLQRGDLRGRAAEAAVERHDRVVVRGEAQPLGLVEQLGAEPAGARRGAGMVIEMKSPGLFCCRIWAAPTRSRSRPCSRFRLLQVEVDRVQAVGGDHLLVGGRGRRRAAADLAELGPVVPPPTITSPPTARTSLMRGHLRVGRDRVGPVPGGGAGAVVRQDEGQVERLRPVADMTWPRSSASESSTL